MSMGAGVNKSDIRSHYNLVTLFYRLFWGPHIHHGLWDRGSSAAQAQQRLVEVLARYAQIDSGERVLDVGCGMGASATHLAKSLRCHVTGITLSPLQCRWAAIESRLRAAAMRTRFQCADAEQVQFPPQSFDVIWSIECTEHLFDKAAFFHRAAQWLRPGGRMAICAWLAGENVQDQPRREQLRRVCEGFLCPSLAARDDYLRWMTQSGLTLRHCEDWTDRVIHSWEVCLRRIRATRVRYLARLIDANTVRFLDSFEIILAAYRSGAMRYGCFVAQWDAES